MDDAPLPAFFRFIGDAPLALSILKFADDFRYSASVFVGKGSQAAILHQVGQITQPTKVACQIVVAANPPEFAVIAGDDFQIRHVQQLRPVDRP